MCIFNYIKRMKKKYLTPNIFLRFQLRNFKLPRFFLRSYKVTILPAFDAGFFSLFNNYVSHLVYAEPNEIIIPDWRLKNIKLETKIEWMHGKIISFCYGNHKDGNVFYKLFENPYPKIKNKIFYETNMMYHFADKILFATDYNQDKEPNLTALNSYNLYADNQYFPIFRNKYNNIVKKYIHLKPEIQNQIDSFFDKQLKGYFVVSAFIRCKGHALELKEKSPDIELWDKKLKEVLESNKIEINSNDWRFFIATDNDNAIEYFTNLYPNNVVYQNMTRLSKEQEEEYESVKNSLGHNTYGYELQHRKAADYSQYTLKNAIEVIFDVYTAALADTLIYTNSNMSTAASYLNPELKMIYCK